MGQAKKRGSFDVRKAQAIERQKEEDKILAEELEERKKKIESITDEERSKMREKLLGNIIFNGISKSLQ